MMHAVPFTPGPLRPCQGALHGLAHPPATHHREPEFGEMLARLQERLPALLGVGPDYGAVLLTSTGTGANEAMLRSLAREGAGQVLSNGYFAERLVTQARAVAGPDGVAVARTAPGAPFPPEAAAMVVAARQPAWVYLVAHETRSGVKNDVAAIVAAIAEQMAARGLPLPTIAVDAMSAAYAYALPHVPAVTAWVTSSAKGINAVPGLGIVVVRRAWAERQARVRAEPGPRGAVWYLDVIEEYASQYEMRRPRFAQSLPLYAALDGACAQWWGTGDGVAEGAVPAPMLAHQARIQRQLTRIVAAVEELYPPILPQMWGAGVVRNLRLPTGRRYEEFAQAMRRRGYFLLCGVPDDDSHVQASTMGSVTDDEVAGLIAALRAEHGGAR